MFSVNHNFFASCLKTATGEIVSRVGENTSRKCRHARHTKSAHKHLDGFRRTVSPHTTLLLMHEHSYKYACSGSSSRQSHLQAGYACAQHWSTCDGQACGETAADYDAAQCRKPLASCHRFLYHLPAHDHLPSLLTHSTAALPHRSPRALVEIAKRLLPNYSETCSPGRRVRAP